MTFNRDNITDIAVEASHLERRASVLNYHAGHKRVSHTVAALIRCILSVSKMCKVVQSDNNYFKLLKRTLDKAHEKASGSMEVTHYPNDNTVWIKGSFHIDLLKDGLITVPQAENTLQTERNDG